MEKNYIDNEYKAYLVKKEDVCVCKMALETFGYQIEEKKRVLHTQLEAMRPRNYAHKEEVEPLETQFFELIERGATIRSRGLKGIKTFAYLFGSVGILAFGSAMSIYLADLMEKGLVTYILMSVLTMIGFLMMIANPFIARKMIAKKQKKNEQILNDNYAKLRYLLKEAKAKQENAQIANL